MAWKVKLLEKLKGFNYLKQERGSILVLVVLLLPIMFGCLGFAYDFGNLYMHRARLQNVADAAALAGARAYLDSQYTTNESGQRVKKEDSDTTRDTVDGIVQSGKVVKLSESRYEPLNGRGEIEYKFVDSINNSNITKTRNNDNHPAADEAADAYIHKNIRNLGNDVKSDNWSHYLLKSSDGESAETFYRVGLSEKVSLYFLPIIKNIPKTQTVRVGAVALVRPGKTTTSGGGLELTPKATFSIFDNLFTYSKSLEETNIAKSPEDKVFVEFFGDMVYTHGNGNQNEFYDVQDENLHPHYYVKHGKISNPEQDINDPTINSLLDITRYISAFKSKLNKSHVDVSGKTFKISELNTSSNIFHFSQNSSYSGCSSETSVPDQNITIDFDKELASDTVPIYLIIDEDITQVTITGTKSTGRPFIIAALADNVKVQLNEYTVPHFKGTIYAPKASEVLIKLQQEGQKFSGNVIAKMIRAHHSENKNVTYEVVNYLENDDYTDTDIQAITNQVKLANNNISDKLTPELKQKILEAFEGTSYQVEVWWPEHKIDTVEIDITGHIGDMEWYKNLSYKAKQALYDKWKVAYSTAPDSIKDLLWGWSGYVEDKGDVSEEGGTTETEPEKLRLINYRTEYQEKNPDGTENKGEKDPFIYLSLDGKSY